MKISIIKYMIILITLILSKNSFANFDDCTIYNQPCKCSKSGLSGNCIYLKTLKETGLKCYCPMLD